MFPASPVRSRRFFALAVFAAALGMLAPTGARSGAKPNCRDLTFGGAAGAASNDKVTLRVVDSGGTSVDDSCQLQVQNNESAKDFAARIVGAWGSGTGSSCLEPNPLPKKSCGNAGFGTRSCNHKFKFKPDKNTVDPNDGLIRVRICCFDANGCKGTKLATTPVSVQTKLDPAVTFGPSVPPPIGITVTPVALDPIGMTQRPFAALQGCRASLGLAVAKLATTEAETLAGCHRDAAAGTAPPTTDCNAVTPLSDPAGRVDGMAQNVHAVIAKACVPAGPPSTFGQSDTACPCPCQHITAFTCSKGRTGMGCGSDFDCDTTPGIGDGRCTLPGWGLAADCILCRTDKAVTHGMTDTYGPVGPPPGPQSAMCVDAVGQGLAGLVKTHTLETSSCQRAADAGSLALPPGTSCRDADQKGRRAAAEQSAAAHIAAGCSTGPPPGSQGCFATLDPTPCVLSNARRAATAATDTVFPEGSAPQPCSPGGAFLEIDAD